jgi:hypothetical protein
LRAPVECRARLGDSPLEGSVAEVAGLPRMSRRDQRPQAGVAEDAAAGHGRVREGL